MPHHTDRPAPFEGRHHKNHVRMLELEEEALDNDDPEEKNWSNAHDVVVVSKQHHRDNIAASYELLKLLNFHHPDKGVTIEVIG